MTSTEIGSESASSANMDLIPALRRILNQAAGQGGRDRVGPGRSFGSRPLAHRRPARLSATTLARALASAIGGRFGDSRTPDLLPGDITGFNVFNQQTRKLEFLPAPVFADVLLADDQSATPHASRLLSHGRTPGDGRQRDVSSAGVFLRHRHAKPDRVARHYPLPEALLDRFVMKLRIGIRSANRSSRFLKRRSASATASRPRRRRSSLTSNCWPCSSR